MTPQDHIDLSADCRVTFHRTLRVPDDGGDYPLPPGLGAMSVYPVAEDEFVIPVHRAEALWLGFGAPFWKPHVLKVGTGSVDAVSGEPFRPSALSRLPQDYVVIPDQPWLDGINAGEGYVRQFVAVPLGHRLTVESQLEPGEEDGGLTLALFDPRPGRFPDEPPLTDPRGPLCMDMCAASMGLGAGGRIRQEVYADGYGIDTWEAAPSRTVRVDLVDALAFGALTGIEAPPPVDARAWTALGRPWFDLISPTQADIAAAERLARVCSLADLTALEDDPLPIPESQVIRLLRLRELVA